MVSMSSGHQRPVRARKGSRGLRTKNKIRAYGRKIYGESPLSYPVSAVFPLVQALGGAPEAIVPVALQPLSAVVPVQYLAPGVLLGVKID